MRAQGASEDENFEKNRKYVLDSCFPLSESVAHFLTAELPMTSSIALQQKSPFQNLTEIPPTTSPIKKLNWDLLRSICNFIKPQEIVKTVHLVCKAWTTLLPNEGILDLSNSKIKSQDLPRLIENYIVGAKLHSLDLSQCDHVGDEEMAYLGGFPSTRLNLQLQEKYQKNFRLEKLKISNCRQITEWGIKQLSTLSLTHLDLSSNLWMTDKAVGYLTALPLKHLSLFWCMNITNEGLKTLARSSNLTSLNLDRCNATNATLKALSKLNLVDLDLGLCKKITDEGLKPLLKTSLQTLGLRGCVLITDSTLQDLSSCPQLTELELSSCPEITDIGLKAIAKCPLKRLGLSEYKDIDDSLKMLSSLPLTTLLIDRTAISDQGMQHLARCSSLTSLNLTDCLEITDSGVKAISHLNLRELNLGECNISDLSLHHLARCSSLKSLSIYQCSKITDEGIKAIRHLKLTLLDLAQTKVSDHCLENLANLPLRSLNLYQCSRITKEACESLEARFSDRLIDFHGIS